MQLKFDGEDMSNIKGLASVVESESIENFAVEHGGRYGMEVTQDLGVNISKFTKFFRIAEIAVRALNVLLMGLIIVVSSIEISKEIAIGGWTTAVIMEVLATGCFASVVIVDTVILIGEVAFAASFSVLPMVGAAIAFIGLIFQIVSMFTRKPINPIVEFIKVVIVGFLNTLELSSKEWVDKQNSSKLLLSPAAG